MQSQGYEITLKLFTNYCDDLVCASLKIFFTVTCQPNRFPGPWPIYLMTWCAWIVGAVRVELCGNLMEGGTTPSVGECYCSNGLVHLKMWCVDHLRPSELICTFVLINIVLPSIIRCPGLGIPWKPRANLIESAFNNYTDTSLRFWSFAWITL